MTIRGRYTPFNLTAFNKKLDHGLLLGLTGDDHTQYLLTDGSRDLTGNWTISSNSITLTAGTLTAGILSATGNAGTSGGDATDVLSVTGGAGSAGVLGGDNIQDNGFNGAIGIQWDRSSANWLLTGGQAIHDGLAAATLTDRSFTPTIGLLYQVVVEVVATLPGNTVTIGGATPQSLGSTGTITLYFTAVSGAKLVFFSENGITMDSVTAKVYTVGDGANIDFRLGAGGASTGGGAGADGLFYLRNASDSSKFLSIAIDSTGDVFFTAVGGDFDFDNDGITTSGLGTLGSLVVDTTTLVANVPDYENRVGIGTASPQRILHLAGDTPFIRLENTGASGKTLEFFAGTQGVGIGTPTTAQQFILNDNAPSLALVIGSNFITLGVAIGITSSGDNNLRLRGAGSGNAGFGNQIQGYNGSGWQTALEVLHKSSGTIDVLLVPSNGGNAGIGTASPDTKLQVVGTSGFGDDAGNETLISATGDITQAGSATASFNSTDCGASCEANAYTVGGVAGIDFSGVVASITVVKGIITAAS